MNRIVLILVTVLIFLLPLSALGQDKPNFFAVKAGLYVFTGDLEDAGHDEDDGFNGEIAYGYNFTQTLPWKAEQAISTSAQVRETIYGEYLSC